MSRAEDALRRMAERHAASERPPDPPPKPAPPAHAICVRPPAIGRLAALLLGPPVGCWCHFNPEAEIAGRKCGRSYPCIGVDCPCPADHRRGWYGWAPAVTRPGGAKSLLSLSESAAAAQTAAVPDFKRWRGLSLILERSPKAKGHPVDVLLQGYPKYQIPPEFDPVAELLWLWEHSGFLKPGQIPCWDWPFEAEGAPVDIQRARLWDSGEGGRP